MLIRRRGNVANKPVFHMCCMETTSVAFLKDLYTCCASTCADERGCCVCVVEVRDQAAGRGGVQGPRGIPWTQEDQHHCHQQVHYVIMWGRHRFLSLKDAVP